jgi:hypothetical protein
MKVSNDTLNVLKNFSTIQSNILIQEGDTLKTISGLSNVMAVCKVADTFDKEVAIYDLNQFLGVVSLFNDPDFDFQDTSVVLKEGNVDTEYRYAEKSTITHPERDLKLPEVKLEFILKEADLEALLKASSILGVTDFLLKGEGDSAKLIVCDLKNPGSNSYSVSVDVVDHGTTGEYTVCLDTDNLKFLSGDYKVNVTPQVCEFTHIDRAKNGLDLTYYVAVTTKNSKLN